MSDKKIHELDSTNEITDNDIIPIDKSNGDGTFSTKGVSTEVMKAFVASGIGGGGLVIDPSKSDGFMTISDNTPRQLKYDSFIFMECFPGNDTYGANYAYDLSVSDSQNGTYYPVSICSSDKFITSGSGGSPYHGCTRDSGFAFVKAGSWIKVSEVSPWESQFKIYISPLSSSGSGGFGLGGAIFYDWEAIDNVNYGIKILIPAGQENARTIDKYCLICCSFTTGTQLFINGISTLNLVGFPTSYPNTTDTPSVMYYLKPGDTIFCAEAFDIGLYASLIPIKTNI